MISETNKKMLTILANALHNKPSDSVDPAEWPDILKELNDQSVFAIPSETLDLDSIDQTEKFKYIQKVTRNIQTFHKVLSEQQKLFDLLNEKQIKAVVLKGAAAAVHYPVPHLRCMGDIDIIVKKEDFEKAFHTLCEAGYKNEDTLERYYRHVGFRSEKNVEIELHNFFSASSNKDQNAILDKYIFDALDNPEKIKIAKYEAVMLPTLENGLVLLAHINQHLGTGLGLRQIIDWMCYIEKHLDDEFWKSEFEKTADKIGMKKLAMVSTAMCKKYLGMNEDITWADELSNDSVCDELMEYILNHGNFGRKDSTESKMVSVMRNFKNPFKAIAELQKTGCRTWKTLDKHSWLRPFAWLYQLFRWIRRGTKNGVTIFSTKQYSEKEQAETEFLNKLGITKL